MTSAAEQLKRLRAKAKREKLESEFLFRWKAMSCPALEREYQFHITRKWRFDFAHAESKVAIEIQGGIWMKKGAHTGGTAVSRDCEKDFAATLRGWAVFKLTDKMINAGNIVAISNMIERRLKYGVPI